MPSPRLSKDNLNKLFSKLRAGHDLEAAGGDLGLSEAQIKIAREKYGDEIAIAFRTGTARLRSKIMDSALTGDNAIILMKLLEHREALFPEEASRGISIIERVILPGKCEHCGKYPSDSLAAPIRGSEGGYPRESGAM